MGKERETGISGAVIFWTCGAGGSDWEKVFDGWDKLGYGKQAPERTSLGEAVKAALQGFYGGPRVLIRPLGGRGGWAVVREEDAGGTLVHTTGEIVQVTGCNVRFAGASQSDVDALGPRISSEIDNVSAGRMTSALVDVLRQLGGFALRESGGIYWLPESSLDDWAKLSAVFEAAGSSNVGYVVKTSKDLQTLRAVADAVRAEIAAAVQEIDKGIADADWGKRAVAHRTANIENLQRKLTQTETALGTSLGDVKAGLDKAETALMAYAATALGEEMGMALGGGE
jgi:hypothetical protein